MSGGILQKTKQKYKPDTQQFPRKEMRGPNTNASKHCATEPFQQPKQQAQHTKEWLRLPVL